MKITNVKDFRVSAAKINIILNDKYFILFDCMIVNFKNDFAVYIVHNVVVKVI